METAVALNDITLPDTNDEPVRLGTLWDAQPALIVWLRHFG